ncbi:Hypothetical protein PHPALM_10534 [Phytophthora palmivora]|uniref:Uncharacterized protein n=1 Tax=Phytophthora palmivora TaxID=4796 RepID=A0A2P4Y4L3_9STRA|nr:Hypothetical protein PHPALM_10534 [Phytophthora palmivora]
MCLIPRQEALCLLLRQLACPSRLEDFRTEFKHGAPVLSSAVTTTAPLIYDEIKDKTDFDQLTITRYKECSTDAIWEGRLADEVLGIAGETM